MLKGAPIRWRCTAPRWTRGADSARESRMVGREAEQAAIRARIDDLVTEDRSATVVIEGERGAGQVAARRARRSAWRARAACACSRPRPTPSRTPRATTPGASMFTDLLEVTAQTMVDPHSLEVPCDPELRRMRPLLSSIVPVGIPDNELTGAMDGSVRAENTKLLLASILRHTTAAGARPGGRRGRSLAGLELVGAAAGDRAVGAAGPGRGDHAPDGRPARAVRAAARAGVDRGPRPASR